MTALLEGAGLAPKLRDFLSDPEAPNRAERRALARMSPGRPVTSILRESFTQRVAQARRAGASWTDALTVAKRELPLVAGGMPTGAGGMAFVHNLPSAGSYIEDTAAFFQNTERNDIPQQSVPFSGLGSGPVDLRIPNVGVLAAIRVIVKGTLVVGGTGAVTSLYRWPWGVFSRLSTNVNGQTSIVSCEGNDLRVRRQRVFRNPREEVSSAPATDTTTGNPSPGVIANGSYPVTLVYDIPIAHDDFNLAGAIYAQSDQNSLSLRLEPAAQSELFSVAAGGTVSLTGTINWAVTIYDIPTGDTQQGRKVLLPDMSWIHGMLATNLPFANTGEVKVALIKTSGQLLATYLYLDNGGAAQIDPLALAELRFEYGGNRRPRQFAPIEHLIEKNVHDYNGRLRPGYVILDNEIDNPVRDLVYPKGVTELSIVATIPVGTTINANARAHFVEETMFTGR